MLEHALSYAAHGCPVFPCKATTDKAAGSKAPHLPGESAPGKRDGGHWLASLDEGVIRGWWKRWPSALIGFPTGLRTRCIVVDLDPREHSTKAMLAALTRFCGHLRETDPETGEIVEPVIARTQSGGLHLYFAWPEEAIFAEVAENLTRLGKPVSGLIGNKANLFSRFLRDKECPEELAHIDVRGEGGYVIAPPSVMADGKRYEWLMPQVSRLPALPRRLRGVITGEFLTDAERAQRRAARQPGARHRSDGGSDSQVARFVDGAVNWALDFARTAPPGQRNQNVFQAASHLGRFVRSGHLDRGRAEALLLANLPAGVEPGEHKINQTIRNGLDATERGTFSPDELGRGRG